MYSKIIRRVISLVLSAGSLLNVNAQSIEEVQKKFPNDYAVILSLNRDTRIFLKNDVPVAETKEQVEILVLDDKANGIYNKYRVYNSSFNELKDIDAYTKVPDGSKYKTIKVSDFKTQSSRSSGVFYDDTKESAFDFPSLVKGAIANVSHTQFHKDPHLLTPFYFTSYMPIVNAKFTVTFPSTMEVKYIFRNNNEKKIQLKEEKKGKQTVYEFTASDIKAVSSYGDAPSRMHFDPHVIFHIASYKSDKGQRVNFFNTVDDLYKWSSGFLKNINTTPSPALKELVDSLIKGMSSNKAKSREIYNWVQDNIKYVAFEDGLEGFVPRQAADVHTKRYGDCKDMASLITAMHKLAGIEAYFTWIGTRDIPYTYSEVPLPITDNHMISTVNLDGEWIYLDGTDPNCVFGTPSKSIQGKQAMLAINDKEYKVLQVPELESDKNYLIDSTVISITDKGIKGKSSVYYGGYFGVDAYNTLQYVDAKDTKDYIKERMSKGSNKFILSDYSIDRTSRSERLLGMKTNFEVPDYGKKVADEYYINLSLDRNYNKALIDTAKRKVAVDNDFKFHVKNYTILELPQGYDISYMPENFNYKNEFYAFNINYTKSADKIIAFQEFKSECMMLEPKEFMKWNDAIKEITNQSKKQLVLKKK